MNKAFVKRKNEYCLHHILPSIDALINYLTSENNDVRIYERNRYIDSVTGDEIHEMNDGLSYTLDKNDKWIVVGSL